MPGQTTQIPFIAGDAASLAVSTTALRALGGANWTSSETTYRAWARIVRVTNCSATLPLYVGMAKNGANPGENNVAPANAVSTTDFGELIPAEGSKEFLVPAGYDIHLIRAAVSTDKARVREFLYR